MPRASPIIAATRRLSTNFAILVSFDVKEGAVSATLRPSCNCCGRRLCTVQATLARKRYRDRRSPLLRL